MQALLYLKGLGSEELDQVRMNLVLFPSASADSKADTPMSTPVKNLTVQTRTMQNTIFVTSGRCKPQCGRWTPFVRSDGRLGFGTSDALETVLRPNGAVRRSGV